MSCANRQSSTRLLVAPHGLWQGCQRAALLALMLMAGCTAPGNSAPELGAPATQPDWVRTASSPPIPAQLGLTPSTRSGHPFDPIPIPLRWRLWRYEVPGIEQLSLPRSSPMDIALVGIDGRIKAIKHGAICRREDCNPIKTRFPAIGILVAQPGQFRQYGLEAGSRIDYGQPSTPPAQIMALE